MKEIFNFTGKFHPDLPIDMRFNNGHLLAIVAYSALMIISAFGNIYVLIIILRVRSQNQGKLSSMYLLLLHLSIADLLVTFLMMPHEVTHNNFNYSIPNNSSLNYKLFADWMEYYGFLEGW